VSLQPADRAAVDDLRADLLRTVDGPVRFDPASRAMWSADASNYRRVPIGVVAPRDVADVEAALSVCRIHDVPVLPVGARTSIAGQSVNTAVVLDFMHLNRVLAIDPDARTARVEPGVICDAVRDAAAPHGLTFGPDPSTHNRCTLGGMIGNNACGSHSVAWGKTVDNVVGLDVLTYRGERMSLGTDGTGAIHPKISIPAALRALGERLGDVRDRTAAAGWDACVVVSDGHVVLGLLRAAELRGDPDQLVDQAMRPGPSTYRPFVPVAELRGIMSDRNLESSPVTTSDGRLVGLVRRQDVGLP